MVPARMGSNRSSRPVASHKRKILPSESSQAHLGRRGKTSITLRCSLAIWKITFVSWSESAFYDTILQREHPFYSSFHAELHWPMKYKNTSNYQHRIILALGHTYSAWTNPRWECKFWTNPRATAWFMQSNIRKPIKHIWKCIKIRACL